MNNKSHSLQKKKLSRGRHFYSILEDENTRDEQQGEELSKLLRKGKQFLYIDINEQKGFKLMQPCQSQLVQEDSLQLGQNYITNLQNLSSVSAKAVSLMLQLKDDIDKKERSSLLMAEEMKKKREKFKQIGSFIVRKQKSNNSIVKPMVYRGMPNELIQNLMLSRQKQQMEDQIKKRESVLLQHYSTITFEENQKQKKVQQKLKDKRSKEYLSDLKNFSLKR